ncbi:MAG: PhoH family protein [Desulfarculaceae bacterium]|nr:PhoH family protein [Desulfarculaceae bacterium]MCF8071620.1 PhoH family protein [Desulfarculaceae bacterium]MCF8103183.1 PhoH family protein [Desulfarculaceae bacterium]MCF8114899.1 PhoH family protein [Desulfarculaceae bacterium]
MSKTYVLDTNVLLHNPSSLFAFQENNVVLPLAVIEEIDDQKKRQDEIGRNARQVSRELDRLRRLGPLAQGVDSGKGGRVRIELNHSSSGNGFPGVLCLDKADNRILNVAWGLKQEQESPVVLVTKDLNLRVKADVLGVPSEDFLNDKVNYDQLYTGIREVELDGLEIDAFYRQGLLGLNGLGPAEPHQFFVMRNQGRPSQSALARHLGGRLLPLVHTPAECFGITPRNKEQRFALELLLDPAVQVVTLSGTAGTGKTLLALASGLEHVLENKLYQRLLVTRPIVPMGQDLGYLPGEKEEKLRPWMQPLYDNLEYLFRDYPSSRGKSAAPMGAAEYLTAQGILEIEALTYIRGRSIPRQFILCDEAQNLTPHMIKTLITRVGEGSKIVFTGDPEQIDHPYLDASSNGLSYLVEKLKSQQISGHVTLVKGERSEVAELGAQLL